MKTSRRLLLGTFLTLLTLPVVLVAYSRATRGMMELPAPERTPQVELAALRDFTEVVIRSDAAFEIVSAPAYSVEFTPQSELRGNFTARVANGTLTIEGYGHRFDGGTSAARIALPDLDRVEVESMEGLTIRNFDVDTLDVTVGFSDGAPLVLENNRIDTLRMTLGPIQNVQLRGNTVGNSEIRHFGVTITTE